MLPTIELAIIVFTSLEGRAPPVSGEEAITKWTPGALSPCKPASRQRLVGHCWRVYRPSGFFPRGPGGGEGLAISQASSPTRTGYYAGVPTAAKWPRNPEQVSIGSWVLFLAKDCWMRRQHAIRVVFRLGGHETGPYLRAIVGLPFSRGDHHRVGSVPFATDGSHLRE